MQHVRGWRVDLRSAASLSCVSLEYINVLVPRLFPDFPYVSLTRTHSGTVLFFWYHPNHINKTKHNTSLNCNTILGWRPVSSKISFQTSTSTKQSKDILTAIQYSSGLQHQMSNKSPQNHQNTSRLQVNTRAASNSPYHTNYIPSLFYTNS
jgi:hypothetical protein